MTDIITIDLDAERMTVAQLRKEWHAERTRLQTAVREAALTKISPGGNYWQAEHQARIRLEAASAFVEALERARKE